MDYLHIYEIEDTGDIINMIESYDGVVSILGKENISKIGLDSNMFESIEELRIKCNLLLKHIKTIQLQ